MKFTIQETQFTADHSIILSDQYDLQYNCLVFKITKGSQDLFVNWNGFTQQMSLENVALNVELLKSLGWKNGDVVDMITVDEMVAQWITVIPKSIQDWSIIELQAEFLENQILSQITIVSKGMEIPLRTSGGIVRVVVDTVFPDIVGAIKLTAGVEIRIVPLKKVDAFKKELRCIPNSLQKFVGASRIYFSSECQVKDQIVKINIIPFINKKKSVDIYAIADVLEDLPLGHAMFSKGFDFIQLDYEIIRYFFVLFIFRVEGPIATVAQDEIINVFPIFAKDETLKESSNVLDLLKLHLDSLLQVEDRVVLFSGMYIDLRTNGACVVQLDCFNPFVVLSKENVKFIQLKLEKYDESRVIESLQESVNNPESFLYFENEFINDISRALKSNICFTETQRQFGVTSMVLMVKFLRF